jgi:gamma-glutamyl:cysteine ligase YbdK (ATP-grasp superfamily)
MPATMTLTYIYSDSTVVLGPLATYSEPHSYDLCEKHSARLTAPNGWNVIRQATDGSEFGPSEDDLMAIADAVREVAQELSQDDSNLGAQTHVQAQSNVGRRGHLRAVPS